MNKKYRNLNEEINRMLTLMGNDNLYGNLVDKEIIKEEVITSKSLITEQMSTVIKTMFKSFLKYGDEASTIKNMKDLAKQKYAGRQEDVLNNLIKDIDSKQWKNSDQLLDKILKDILPDDVNTARKSIVNILGNNRSVTAKAFQSLPQNSKNVFKQAFIEKIENSIIDAYVQNAKKLNFVDQQKLIDNFEKDLSKYVEYYDDLIPGSKSFWEEIANSDEMVDTLFKRMEAENVNFNRVKSTDKPIGKLSEKDVKDWTSEEMEYFGEEVVEKLLKDGEIAVMYNKAFASAAKLEKISPILAESLKTKFPKVWNRLVSLFPTKEKIYTFLRVLLETWIHPWGSARKYTKLRELGNVSPMEHLGSFLVVGYYTPLIAQFILDTFGADDLQFRNNFTRFMTGPGVIIPQFMSSVSKAGFALACSIADNAATKAGKSESPCKQLENYIRNEFKNDINNFYSGLKDLDCEEFKRRLPAKKDEGGQWRIVGNPIFNNTPIKEKTQEYLGNYYNNFISELANDEVAGSLNTQDKITNFIINSSLSEYGISNNDWNSDSRYKNDNEFKKKFDECYPIDEKVQEKIDSITDGSEESQNEIIKIIPTYSDTTKKENDIPEEKQNKNNEISKVIKTTNW
jgi:predicted transcriptional regulator